MKKIFFLYILIFFIIPYNSFSNEIFNIRLLERDEYVRLFFEMKQQPKYYVSEMENNSIKVDILDSKLIDENLYKIIENTNEIKNINFTQSDTSSIFFINLNKNANLKRFLYTAPDNINNFYRLIIDINKSKSMDQKKNENTAQKTQTDNNLDSVLTSLDIENDDQNLNDFLYQNSMFEFNDIDELIKYSDIEPQDIQNIETQNNTNFELNNFIDEIYKADKDIKHKEQLSKTDKNIDKKIKQFIVVLDAGHGGKDSGAIGKKGTKEKDINLLYVKEIANNLNRYKNIKVILTRDNDRFIELTDRVIISMKSKADLFISIHADSSKNSQTRGTSIYTLNEDGFNKRTVEIIKKTNSFFNFLKNKNKLINKAKKNNLYKSNKVANMLVNNFKQNRINMLTNPHKQANFAVLLSPNYPSILIELAFLSNKKDEKMLNSYLYRKHISKSIAETIVKYSQISLSTIED